MTPRFGLNRFDSRSVDAFAADVARAESSAGTPRSRPTPSCGGATPT